MLQYDDEFEDGYSIDILITKDNEIALLTSYDSEEEIDKLHIVGLSSNGDVLWIRCALKFNQGARHIALPNWLS